MPLITNDSKKVILIDIYETLLDMQNIRRKINGLIDSKRAYMHWFDLLMQYSLVDNSTGTFHSFSEIAEATLKMAGKDLGKDVSKKEVDDIMYHLGHLPVHEGVSENLSRLKDAGFRLAAITNTPKNIITGRMERTGLVSYFENILCADEIQKYKPALEVYDWAVEKLKVQKKEVLYVSAHGWDVIGAMHAGLECAYLQQAELLFYPLANKPHYSFKNFDKFVQECTVAPAE